MAGSFKIKYSSFVKPPRQPEIRIRFGCGGQKKQGFVAREQKERGFVARVLLREFQ
jgi:hypothetical protein